MRGKSMIVGAAALVLLGTVLLAGLLSAAPVAAGGSPTGSITVRGFGEAAGTPDVAYVTLGIEIRNEDLNTAMDEADSGMTAIIDSLYALDIPAEDIQTLDFSVWSEESRGPEGPALDASRFYRVTNIVRVTLRDTNLVQSAIDAAVTAGANRIHGITFGLDNPAALEADARIDALDDARERAQQIADALGVTLGDPIVVNEGGSTGSPYRMDASRGIGGGGIQEGQLSVSVQVEVTYELVR